MRAHYVLVDFENVQPRNLELLRGGGCRIKVFLGSQQGKLDLDFVQAVHAFGPDAEYIRMAGSGKNALDFHLAWFLGKLCVEHPDADFSIISRDTGFDPLVRYLKTQGFDCRRSATVAELLPAKAGRAEPEQAAASPARTRRGRSAPVAPKPVAPKPVAPKPVPASRAPAPAPSSPAKPSSATASRTPAATPTRTAAASRTTPANAARATPATPANAATAASTPAAPRKRRAAKAPGPAVEPARLELVLHNLRKRDKGLPKTLKTLRSTVASLLVKPAARDGEVEALLAQMQGRGLLSVDGNRVDYSLG